MSVLNSWQRIDRVIPEKPFGDGIAGDYSSATVPDPPKLSISGVATETHIHGTAGQFSAGDVIFLHQSRGTGVGQWEINQVTADNGDGTYNLKVTLQYTYTDSGASQAQAVKVFRYKNVEIPTGATWTTPPWNGDVGGIFPLAIDGNLTITGTLNAIGIAGASSYSTNWLAGGAGAGYMGGTGDGRSQASHASYQGEGTTGAGGVSTAANGTGGGGSSTSNWGGGSGGGGGHALSGTNGYSTSGGAVCGTGGGSGGTADLTTMIFGGAGGGGCCDSWNVPAGGGGGGGPIVVLFVKNITSVNSLNNTGGEGGHTGYGPGGGGAGGSVLIVCGTGALGTDKIISLGEDGYNNGSNYGGTGSVGRIAVHHSGTVTGTTNPTFTDVTDLTLVEKESAGGIIII